MQTFFMDYWPVIAAVVGTLGVGGVAILIIGWPVVAAFLTGTKFGRWIIAGVFIAIALLLLASSMKRKGAQAERAKQAARRLLNAQRRIRKDEAIRNRSAGDVRKSLERWVRE